MVEIWFWVVYLFIYSYGVLLAPRSWGEIFEIESSDDVAQIISLVFVLTHIVDEMDQAAAKIPRWTADGVRFGVGRWWASHWNKFDFAMCDCATPPHRARGLRSLALCRQCSRPALRAYRTPCWQPRDGALMRVRGGPGTS